jgi:hypothetical protein
VISIGGYLLDRFFVEPETHALGLKVAWEDGVLRNSENRHRLKCVFAKGFDVAAKQGSACTRYMCMRTKKESRHNGM